MISSITFTWYISYYWQNYWQNTSSFSVSLVFYSHHHFLIFTAKLEQRTSIQTSGHGRTVLFWEGLLIHAIDSTDNNKICYSYSTFHDTQRHFTGLHWKIHWQKENDTWKTKKNDRFSFEGSDQFNRPAVDFRRSEFIIK